MRNAVFTPVVIIGWIILALKALCAFKAGKFDSQVLLQGSSRCNIFLVGGKKAPTLKYIGSRTPKQREIIFRVNRKVVENRTCLVKIAVDADWLIYKTIYRLTKVIKVKLHIECEFDKMQCRNKRCRHNICEFLKSFVFLAVSSTVVNLTLQRYF